MKKGINWNWKQKYIHINNTVGEAMEVAGWKTLKEEGFLFSK